MVGIRCGGTSHFGNQIVPLNPDFSSSAYQRKKCLLGTTCRKGTSTGWNGAIYANFLKKYAFSKSLHSVNIDGNLVGTTIKIKDFTNAICAKAKSRLD